MNHDLTDTLDLSNLISHSEVSQLLGKLISV